MGRNGQVLSIVWSFVQRLEINKQASQSVSQSVSTAWHSSFFLVVSRLSLRHGKAGMDWTGLDWTVLGLGLGVDGVDGVAFVFFSSSTFIFVFT